METVKPKDRLPGKEYPSQERISTPVTFRGNNLKEQEMKEMLQEWSLRQAEENHVETLEEANDFDIGHEEEDFDFLHGLTVYEMQDEAATSEVPLEATDPQDPYAGGPQDPDTEALDSDQTPTAPTPAEPGGARGE